MKCWQLRILFIFIAAFLVHGCARERQDFEPIVNVQLQVVDDLGRPVNGAQVYAFLNEQDYENAFTTLDFSRSVIQNVVTADRVVGSQTKSGIATFTLQPERDHYIFIAYYDNGRFFSMSNFGVTGRLTKVPPRTNLVLESIIRPVNGNVIFYTSNANRVPIQVSIGTPTNNNVFIGSITGIYSGNGSPAPGDLQVLRVQRDPGAYTYYAKSDDGCAWTGMVTLQAGQNQFVDLSMCQMGTAYFYTTSDNFGKLPISITFGGLNLSNEANMLSVALPVGTTLECTSATPSSSVVRFRRSPGIYSYFAQSSDGSCIWTGTVTLTESGCVVVPLTRCNF